MRLLCFEHHPLSPAGLVAERAAARGASLNVLAAQNGTPMPADADRHDGMIILGGAMNAYADEACPHFPALLDLARSYAAAGKPVLGICLGAQLIARAWGARVHVGAAPEFGLVPLRQTAAGAADPLLEGLPAEIPAMQWHDDTFDLPAGAELLLTAEACRHQAFRVDGVVYAFQCHLETDRTAMLEWAVSRRERYGLNDVPPDFPAQVERQGAAAEALGRRVADGWLDLVAARRA